MKLEELVSNKVPAAAFDLFSVFARFEYALKRSGFRDTHKPFADWEALAKEFPEDFFTNALEIPEVRILVETPPKQLRANKLGGVEWSAPIAPAHDAWTLIQTVKRVRNNLFHGDKKYSRERDMQLILASLHVLNFAYQNILQTEGNEKFAAFVVEFSMDY